MRCLLLIACAGALRVLPTPPMLRQRTSLAVRMMTESRKARIDTLGATLKQLAADGYPEELLAPLKAELNDLKLEDLKQQLAALKSELSDPAQQQPAPAPSPPPPPSRTDAVIDLCDRIDALALAGATDDKAWTALKDLRARRTAEMMSLFTSDRSAYLESLKGWLDRIPEADFPVVGGAALTSAAAVAEATQARGRKGNGTPSGAAAPPAEPTSVVPGPEPPSVVTTSSGKTFRVQATGARAPPPAELDEPPPPPPAEREPPPPPPRDPPPPQARNPPVTQDTDLLNSLMAAVFGPPKSAEQEARLAAERARRQADARAAAERRVAEQAEQAELDRAAAERLAAQTAAQRQAAEAARRAQDAETRRARAEAERRGAADVLQAALAGVEFGAKFGASRELRAAAAPLRGAIEAARAAGVAADDVTRARAIERQMLERAEAAAAAEKAAAEQAAREKAEAEYRDAQMTEARELLRRSIARPADQRKKILRELQVRWHPDKWPADDAKAREFAEELSRIANEAAMVAKKQAVAARAKQRRMEAFDELARYLNGPASAGQVVPLRAAIDAAREAGVSESEISRAEERLRRLERA